MKTTKVQDFILFTLGYWFDRADREVGDKPVKVSISKKSFIDLMLKAGFAKKQERALYKNLETLEKRNLITYKNKGLQLNEKGKTRYYSILKQINPYFGVLSELAANSPMKYCRKVQTIFK